MDRRYKERSVDGAGQVELVPGLNRFPGIRLDQCVVVRVFHLVLLTKIRCSARMATLQAKTWNRNFDTFLQQDSSGTFGFGFGFGFGYWHWRHFFASPQQFNAMANHFLCNYIKMGYRIVEIMQRLLDEFIVRSQEMEKEEVEEAMKLLVELELALYNINHRFCR